MDSGATVHSHVTVARGGMANPSPRGPTRSVSRTLEHCWLWLLLHGVARVGMALVRDGSAQGVDSFAAGKGKSVLNMDSRSEYWKLTENVLGDCSYGWRLHHLPGKLLQTLEMDSA